MCACVRVCIRVMNDMQSGIRSDAWMHDAAAAAPDGGVWVMRVGGLVPRQVRGADGFAGLVHWLCTYLHVYM